MTRWIASGDGGHIGPQGEIGAAASNFATVTDSASLLEGRQDPNVGTELDIAAVMRGLFGAEVT